MTNSTKEDSVGDMDVTRKAKKRIEEQTNDQP